MNDEPGFFDHGGKVVAFARHSDPDTSREAAESVTPTLRKIRLAVLHYAAGVPGFTDPDLSAHFGVTSSTYRTRRAELVGMGLIADTGERRGESGRRHAVWAITERGLAMVHGEAA